MYIYMTKPGIVCVVDISRNLEESRFQKKRPLMIRRKCCMGVATISRIDKIIGLFCRI